MIDFFLRFLCLNFRIWNGNMLLYLVVWYGIFYIVCSLYDWEYRMCGGMFKFFCIEIMRLILYVGCDVNVMNIEGNILYLIVVFKLGLG